MGIYQLTDTGHDYKTAQRYPQRIPSFFRDGIPVVISGDNNGDQ